MPRKREGSLTASLAKASKKKERNGGKNKIQTNARTTICREILQRVIFVPTSKIIAKWTCQPKERVPNCIVFVHLADLPFLFFFSLPPPVLDQRQWDWNIFKADRAHLPHPFESVDLLCRSTVQVLENCSIELWGFELCQKYYYYTSAATPPPVTGSSHTWGKRGRNRNYWTEHFSWMEFFTNANRAMRTFGHVGAFLIDLPCCRLRKIRINV